MAINATPGAANADAYATLAEADAYIDTILNAGAWATAVDADQERALKMARRLLDSYYTWLGTRTYEVQALDFPRLGLTRDNSWPVDSTTIPHEIRDASIQFGLWLLENNPNEENEVAAQGITEIKVSTIQLKFKDVIASRTIPDFIDVMIPKEWYENADADAEALKTSIFEVV